MTHISSPCPLGSLYWTSPPTTSCHLEDPDLRNHIFQVAQSFQFPILINKANQREFIKVSKNEALFFRFRIILSWQLIHFQWFSNIHLMVQNMATEPHGLSSNQSNPSWSKVLKKLRRNKHKGDMTNLQPSLEYLKKNSKHPLKSGESQRCLSTFSTLNQC